jgi:two-component system sensor histidine kinase YesM
MILFSAGIIYKNGIQAIMQEKDKINSITLYSSAADINDSFLQLESTIEYISNNRAMNEEIAFLESMTESSYKSYYSYTDVTEYLTNSVNVSPLISIVNIITPCHLYSSNYMTNSSLYSVAVNDNRLIKDLLQNELILLTDTMIQDEMKPIEDESESKYMADFLEKNPIYAIYNYTYQDISISIMVILDTEYLEQLASSCDMLVITNPQSQEIYTLNSNGSEVDPTIENYEVYDWENINCNIDFKIGILRDISNNFFSDLSAQLLIFCTLTLLIAWLFSSFVSKRVVAQLETLKKKLSSYNIGGNLSGGLNIHSQAKVKKRLNSLKERLFLYLMIIMFVSIMSFNLMMYNATVKVLYYEISASNKVLFLQKKAVINRHFDKIHNISQQILSGKTASILLSDIPREKKADEINNILEQLRQIGLEDLLVVIYDAEDIPLCAYPDASHEFAAQQYISNEITLYKPEVDVCFSDNNKAYVRLSLPMHHQSSPIAGRFAIFIRNSTLSHESADLNTEYSQAYLYDEDGTILSHYYKENVSLPYLTQENEQNDEIVVYSAKIDSYPIAFTYIYSYDMMRQRVVTIFQDIYILFVALLFIIVVISYIISHWLLLPINKIYDTILESGEELLTVRFNETPILVDEVNVLANTFNSMMDRIDELVDTSVRQQYEAQQLELKKRDAETIALQAQVDPHLLYNTLNSISFLISKDQAPDAQAMIRALSRFFRKSALANGSSVTLDEELQCTKAYGDIMEIRHKDSVSIEYKIEQAAKSIMVPRMIIQPFVENSIKHGTKKDGSLINIVVSCSLKKDRLFITIEDNGRGIDAEKLTAINNELTNNLGKYNLGIFNVNARIKMNYGNEYGVSLFSLDQKTKVVITLPNEA